MSETHLIHITIDMKQFHCSCISTNLKKLAVSVAFEQTGFLLPYRLVVYIVFSGTAMAIVSKGGDNQTAEQDEIQFYHHCIFSWLLII
jgi:hypothetical protein